MNSFAVPSLILPFLVIGCALNVDDLATPLETGLKERTGFSLDDTRRATDGSVSIPPSVSLTNVLSEDEAVEVALWNNAAFAETLEDLGLAKAEIVAANQLPNPSFSMLFPLGEKQLEFVTKYPLEAIWLRPRRVNVARRDAERVAQQLVVNGLDLIRDVRLAHTEVCLNAEQLELARMNLELNREIADASQTRMDAGDANELEVISIRSGQLKANDDLLRIEGELRLARENLRKMLGLGSSDLEFEVASKSGDPPGPGNVTEIVNVALASRPDLRAAELAIEGAGEELGLAQKEVFTLIAMLDANGDASNFEAGPGIDIQVPVFNQNQAGKSRAEAKLKKAERHYITVRDDLILNVRQAHIRAIQARSRVAIWRDEIIPPLQGAESQLKTAYRDGNIPFLQLLDTSRQLADARISLLQTRVEMHRAVIELEHSAGRKL